MFNISIKALLTLTIVFDFILGAFLLKRKRKEINVLFALICFSVGLWGLSILLYWSMNIPWKALFFSKCAYTFAGLVPIFFLKFVLVYPRRTKLANSLHLINLLLLSIIILIWYMTWNNLIVSGVVSSKWGYDLVTAKFYSLYLRYFMGIMSISFFILFIQLRNSKGIERLQIMYVLVGCILSTMLGSIPNLILPFLGITKYTSTGPIFSMILVIFISYAILKYRLMDIRVAITRTGIFVAVYTLVLGLPFVLASNIVWRNRIVVLIGSIWWTVPLGLMAVLATLGPFIYIYLNRKAEERLLKEQRRYQNILKEASLGMTRIRDLRRLLNLITHIVTKSVKISYIGIYLYHRDSDEFLLEVSRDKGRTPIPKLTPENALITWIQLKRQPLIYEEVKRQAQDSPDPAYKQLEENMRALTASVVLPSFLEDRFLGFIVLGEKMSGQIYTAEDLNVFQVLASQAALAIENAQFYHDAKDMQLQIAQAEKMATIGTMADGLSHQINNRFYALSLIAGDSMDTLKLTDTSNCTPEVKEMLSQISHALERIQVNVMQGSEVVKGMLKYSRTGSENFEALSLDQVIDGTLEMVQFKVKLSEIDIVRDYPKETPKIHGNLAQLEEVFFNFIDNAYDAIVERRTMLKEEGYRGRVTVSAHPKDTKLEITIEDNGMGVKDDDNKKLFTPFFTTKSSSRTKGTGLGLYVINKIITDAHKGKIAFESDYKVGTRFIVELPLAK